MRPSHILTTTLVAIANTQTAHALQYPKVVHHKPNLSTTSSAHARLYTAPPTLTAAAAAAAPPPKPSAGASVPSSVISLAKNIVGSGVLALAAGVAAFSSRKLALLPATAILLALGGLSAYTFSLIARVGVDVGADTYQGAWTKVLGERSSVLVSSTITFMTCAAALSYAIIIGDSFASVASLAGAPALLRKPNSWILLLSTFVLLPLSLLRDLSALAPAAVVGTAGTIYTALFTTKRYLDGSYAAGGRFIASLATKPEFATSGSVINLAMFVLISMCSSAYVAHYNAPRFYKELAPPPDGSPKLGRFNRVVGGGFTLAALLSVVIMAAGFLTFGASTQGFLLNNYATADVGALIARLGIGVSIVTSYPLNFVALRDGVCALFNLSKYAPRTDFHWAITLTLLCAFNGLALVLKDLGLIVALGGAVLGSAIVYIFPALMFIANMRRKQEGGVTLSKGEKAEVVANKALVAIGAVLGVVGAVTCLK